MRILNRFTIGNDLAEPLSLNIEPEGVFFPLASGEEVTVVDEFTSYPVMIKLSQLEGGRVRGLHLAWGWKNPS